MAFKMKQFSGFGNSPMKQDGKLSKKKKDLKTNEDITPKSKDEGFNVLPGLPKGSKPKSNDEAFNVLPGLPKQKKKKKTSTEIKSYQAPFVTGPGEKKKKKKTSTDSAREKYFKN
jgi:hypothetical protein